VVFATVNAAPAERALPRIVCPGEFLPCGSESDGSRGAAEPAHRASGAASWIELHQAAIVARHGRSSRKSQRGHAAAQILPQQSKDLHERNLMSNVAEMATTANAIVHCQ